MKKLEMIIRLEKLEELKSVLNRLGVKGMTVSTVMGCGNQKGSTEIYRGKELNVSLLHKIKIEVVVVDSMVESILSEVTKSVSTGKVGDGKIFVLDVENAVRIRTGEKGETAL